MPMMQCPHCNQRVVSAIGNTDVVHECNSGDATLDQEDVIVIGTWEDYTGSATVHNAHLQGLGDEIQFQEAHVRGERDEPLSVRGKKTSTHRSRQKLQTINFTS